MSQLNKKELALLDHFLEEYLGTLHNAGCNDVPIEAWDGWTEEEQKAFAKEFYKKNGDPENWGDEPASELPDHNVVWLLKQKLLKMEADDEP